MNDIIETRQLTDFAEKAYLDYSMYVILDRALPHIADGFKPVQRRIVYAMSELGLKAAAKHKKSARTVGDVLGKFHPHGDTACYEAMVLMAQPFSYRYPLVDGQGNWGSADEPKSFAAMRYTEARLSVYADVLLGELQLGTTDWVDNFDATLKEPALLPARLPNVLLNGATGIAVGMSADILPHNLGEVADACMHLLDNPKATLVDIMEFIKGPDFPTAAEIITPTAILQDLYRTGHGSVRMRAVYGMEGHNIVITALPWQVSGARIMEQIAREMQQKKLPMLDDLRDESDHEHPTRLVLVPRSGRVDVETLMLHLFAVTDLERSYRVNFNMIGLNGKPAVKNLPGILQEWLTFRLATVRRRLEFRLDKILARLHILAGLLIAYLNLDEVIAIIRASDEPKAALMERFQLDEIQAQAILEMKLRHLAKLEEIKIKTEIDELGDERAELEKILGSEQRLRTLVKKEIATDREKYADPRRSPVVTRMESRGLKEEEIIPNEPVTVILSQKGWVRAARGHEVNGENLGYKAGDSFKMQIHARTGKQTVFFDSDGKVYSLPTHVLPSARGQGEPLTGKLNPGEGAVFTSMVCGEDEDLMLIASDAGFGFVVPLGELYVKSRSGKALLKLPPESKFLPVQKINNKDTDLLACVTNVGRMLIFNAHELPELARGKGNKLISIPKTRGGEHEEFIVDLVVMAPTDTLTIYAGKRFFAIKGNDLDRYRGVRGRRGASLPRGLQNVTALKVTVDSE